jgi:hypothetical protein
LALPYFDLKEKGFISSYLYLKNKDNDWKDQLILEFKDDSILKNDIDLVSHTWYVNKYYKDESIIYHFNIPSNIYNTIVKPFLNGEYSKIDKDYVNKNYSKWIKDKVTGEILESKIFKVFSKDKTLKQNLETNLNIVLSEDAELESKPLKCNELYLYSDIEEMTEINRVKKLLTNNQTYLNELVASTGGTRSFSKDYYC